MEEQESTPTEGYRGRMFYYLVALLVGVVVVALVLAALLSFSTLAEANRHEAEAFDTVIRVYDLYLQGMSSNQTDYSILTADGVLAAAAASDSPDTEMLTHVRELLSDF
ncbi:MAG: hypothetical protein LBI64_06520 [Coriobacteriales bacterium]|nr:hypothetical protein [Coriobacteriales bacterium]